MTCIDCDNIIYHTETQEDFNALMIELEGKGYVWVSGRKPTESKDWVDHKENTCVVIKKKMSRACIGVLKLEYPNIPIIKYKTKADEKMRFTKENVGKVIDEYFWQADLEPCGDLIAEIRNLDCTPEKVVVPKCVAEFYELYSSLNLQTILYHCDYSSSRYEDFRKWYLNQDGRHKIGRSNSQEIIAKMYLYGYEVEKEPLYCVNINGQYLVKMIPERNVHKFVEEVKLCVWDTQAYQLTEAEIKAIDERYIPFMVPVGDEHENNE